jgi:hypothetical protein
MASKVFRSDTDENANGRFVEESVSSSPNKRDFVYCQQPNAFLERIFGLKTTITPGKRASRHLRINDENPTHQDPIGSLRTIVT